MKSLVLSIALLGSGAASGFASSPAEAQAPPPAPVMLKSVEILPASDGPLIEILTNSPVKPQIRKLENPPRLVLDLPATILTDKKPVATHSPEIKSVRVDQMQSPPVVHIVAMLRKPLNFHTEQVGNRVTVHLTEGPDQPEETAAPPESPQPTPTVSGVSLGDTRIMRGSSVTAGLDTASLRLRDGEIRVCPGTTVSLTPSPSGHDLMMGLSTGTIETHYSLQTSADSIMTPDFRIQLPGPGEFDFAIGADAQGNTCVRSLARNTASIVVAELLGDRSYQVKPNEQVMFHLGRIDSVDNKVPSSCGCPSSVAPSAVASNAKPEPLPEGPTTLADASPLPTSKGETEALPKASKNDVSVTIDAPFVFRATPPAPTAAEIAALPVHTAGPEDTLFASIAPTVLPPEPTALQSMAPLTVPKPHRSVYTRVKHFLGKVF